MPARIALLRYNDNAVPDMEERAPTLPLSAHLGEEIPWAASRKMARRFALAGLNTTWLWDTDQRSAPIALVPFFDPGQSRFPPWQILVTGDEGMLYRRLAEPPRSHRDSCP